MLQNLKCRVIEHSKRQGDFIDLAEQCNNMTAGERSSGSTLLDSDYSSSSSTGQKYNPSIWCYLITILFWQLSKYKLICSNEFKTNIIIQPNTISILIHDVLWTLQSTIISLEAGLKMVCQLNIVIPICHKEIISYEENIANLKHFIIYNK